MDKNTLDSAYPFETTLTGFLSKAEWGSKRKLIFLYFESTEFILDLKRKKGQSCFPNVPNDKYKKSFWRTEKLNFLRTKKIYSFSTIFSFRIQAENVFPVPETSIRFLSGWKTHWDFGTLAMTGW